jgi:cytochrome c oxidase assembly protein subunit 15
MSTTELDLTPPQADEIRHRRQIAGWLLVCAAMVFAMVVLGGVTRLTGSGLSMVEWDPIFGIVPPLDAAQWEQVFEKYQSSPEYQKINIDMDLAAFKRIFLVEYAHRVLGRAIGIVFLLPLVFFVVTHRIPRGLSPKLVALFVLGGLQGLLGWYMVKSGLVDDPHVSPYRLTAHLMLAVALYGYMIWVALGLLLSQGSQRIAGARAGASLRRFAAALAGWVFLTMASGGFVAGLKAGRAYNTFPLMEGRWIPSGIWGLQPGYRNLFENIATVQFDHRVAAITTFVGILALWLAGRGRMPSRGARYALHGLAIMGMVQLGLGISTLLLHVPVPLAVAHQGGALVLFTLILIVAQRLRIPEAV